MMQGQQISSFSNVYSQNLPCSVFWSTIDQYTISSVHYYKKIVNMLGNDFLGIWGHFGNNFRKLPLVHYNAIPSTISDFRSNHRNSSPWSKTSKYPNQRKRSDLRKHLLTAVSGSPIQSYRQIRHV
jgi:hypothetical protein